MFPVPSVTEPNCSIHLFIHSRRIEKKTFSTRKTILFTSFKKTIDGRASRKTSGSYKTGWIVGRLMFLVSSRLWSFVAGLVVFDIGRQTVAIVLVVNRTAARQADVIRTGHRIPITRFLTAVRVGRRDINIVRLRSLDSHGDCNINFFLLDSPL